MTTHHCAIDFGTSNSAVAIPQADGSPRLGANHARCLACHQPLADKGHVFSIDALKAQAVR